MRSHLQKHPELKATPSEPVQPKISHFCQQKKMDLTSKRGKEITEVIFSYIVADLKPISTIESEAFRKLVETLEPKYPTPSRTYITANVMPKLYNKKVEDLKKELEGVECVGMTHDMWTSVNTDSYGTFTVQYINDDFELKCKVLETRKVDG